MLLKTSKKVKIRLLYIFITMILLALLSLAYIIYDENFKESELFSFNSDNGYILKIVEVGETNIEYGSTNCKFKLIKDDQVVNTYKFVVLNDYKKPEEDDFDIEWGDENVRVIVSGDKQNDLIYFLNYSH